MEQHQERETWRRSWIPMAIGLLILLVPLSTTFQHGGGPMDEGTLLVYPEMVQRGALPHRDFETFYGPANPFLLAAVYTVFGTNIGVERTVGFLYRALILVALFGLAKRWGTTIAAGCMIIAGVILLPLGVVAYAWLAALACALCFVWALATPEGDWRCLGAGVLAGLAMSFRPDVGPAVLLAAWVLIQPLSWRLRTRFILGGALGLIPCAIVFLSAGPEQAFNNLFLYPVLRSGPARRIPISAAEPFLVRLFFAQVLAAALNIAAAIVAIRLGQARSRDRVLLALALLGAGVLLQSWQRLDLYHVLFVAFLTIGTLPLSLFSILSRRNRDKPLIAWALVSIATVAILVCLIAPIFPKTYGARLGEALQTEATGSEFVHKGPRSFPVGPPERAVLIGRMLDQLDKLSVPGQRLFVGPTDLRAAVYCDTFLYHLLPKLQPATYFLEMNPQSANRPGSRLSADIASADWLILNSEWTAGAASATAHAGFGEPEKIVRDRFKPIGRYGSFTLFERTP